MQGGNACAAVATTAPNSDDGLAASGASSAADDHSVVPSPSAKVPRSSDQRVSIKTSSPQESPKSASRLGSVAVQSVALRWIVASTCAGPTASDCRLPISSGRVTKRSATSLVPACSSAGRIRISTLAAASSGIWAGRSAAVASTSRSPFTYTCSESQVPSTAIPQSVGEAATSKPARYQPSPPRRRRASGQ